VKVLQYEATSLSRNVNQKTVLLLAKNHSRIILSDSSTFCPCDFISAELETEVSMGSFESFEAPKAEPFSVSSAPASFLIPYLLLVN
jgi:hypothetical protein